MRQALGSHFFDGLNCLTRGIARSRVTVHRDGRVHVEAVDVVGAEGRGNGHELRNRRHLVAVLDLNLMQALDVGAVLALALHHHAVNLTEAVEVGAVKSAVVALQRGKDSFGRDAGTLTLGCVDVDEVLRKVRAEVGLCRLDFGTLFKVGEEGLSHFVELVEVAAGTVLQIECKAVGRAVTRHHRRLEEEHLRVLKHFAGAEVEVGKDNGGAFGHAAFFPLFQLDDERAVRRALAADETVARNHGA